MYTATSLHLSKTSSANDIAKYLTDGLSIGDYYNAKGTSFGEWHGELVDTLDIDRGVSLGKNNTAFVNLILGRHPETGELIKSHKARSHGVAGYDFVVNPDKSVSVMAMLDSRIIEAHRKANELALAEIEKNASRRMRTGPQNNRIELPNKYTGNMLACSFQHDLSRANDPQLHIHNFIFNMTQDDNGKFYSLDQKEMRRSIRYFSNIYNSILAKEMENLGYKTEPVKYHGRIVSFRLAEVEKEICDIYSSRRQDILLEAEVYKKEKNLDRALSAVERDIIARATRAGKKILTEKEKTAFAKSKVDMFQWSALEAIHDIALIREYRHDADYEKIVNLAIEHLFERKSTVALREIYSEAITQNFGSLDYHGLQQYLSDEKNLEKHLLLDLELTRECPEAERFVTTTNSLKREAYSVNSVNKGIEKCMPFNEQFKPFDTEEYLEFENKNHINFDDQRILINDILVSRDRFLNIRGKAGTGKTTMSKELVRGIEENSGKVIVLAPTNTAVDTLKENGFKALTVAKFLYSFKDRDISNTTILIDEAGLLSSKQGSQLLYLAEKNNCRIIFSGDTHQHSSVEAGDFVRGLEEYSKILTFSLSTINRQQIKEYKKVVELLSDNKTKEGLETLDRYGKIRERSDYIRSAVEDFKLEDFTVPKRCLYVATTNAEVDILNDQIRAKVKSFGHDFLQNDVKKTIFIRSNMTVARSKQAGSYNPGDYIHINRKFQSFRHGEYYRIENVDTKKNRIFLDNGKFINIENHFSDIVHGFQRDINLAEGEKIICTAISRADDLFNGEVLTVKELHCKVDGEDYIKCINNNGKVKFMPQNFRHFKYAYAVTSHRSQGTTVDNVVVVAGNLNSESAYVALSRGRLDCQIHTPDKQELINNAMDYVRPLALDIIDHENKRNILKTINHNKEFERIEQEFKSWYSQKNKSIDTPNALLSKTVDISKLNKEKSELHNLVFRIDELQNRVKTFNRKLDRFNNEEKLLKNELSKLKHDLVESKKQEIPVSDLLFHPIRSARIVNNEESLNKQIANKEQELSEFRNRISSERETLSKEVDTLNKKIQVHRQDYNKLEFSVDIATKTLAKERSKIQVNTKGEKERIREHSLGISR